MNYNHLNINERACIYQFKNLGMSVREIAKALNIPFETSYEAFKGVKTISADRQELTAYRIDVKTKEI